MIALAVFFFSLSVYTALTARTFSEALLALISFWTVPLVLASEEATASLFILGALISTTLLTVWAVRVFQDWGRVDVQDHEEIAG